MEDDSRRKTGIFKKLKWVAFLLIVLLTTVFGILAYFYRKIEPIVATRIKETIHTSTNGLYSISFSDLSINPFTGNVTLQNIRFAANYAVYQRFKREKINPNHLYEVRVKAIRLRKVHPLKVYFRRDLVIRSVLIENPTVRVYYDRTLEKDFSKADTRTAWQKLSKYLKSIKIEQVFFRDIDFKYIDRRLNKPEINGIKNLSITLKDILIDSLSHRDTSRFYSTKDVLVEVLDNEFPSADGMYSVRFDKLEMSTRKKYAFCTGLRVHPKFPDREFTSKFPLRTARYLFASNEIRVNGVDYKNLADNRKLRAGSLTLSGGNLEIFMSKERPKADADLGANFPQLRLQDLRLTSTIDTVEIKESRVVYTEYNPHTGKRGKIEFLALNGQVLNFTNDSLSLLKNNWASCRFTGFPYGKGRLDFNINFNLTSPMQVYNYSGKLHQMQARHFNQITRPLALLDISSGAVKSATFSVNADYRTATGTMTILYQDLNIGILKLNRNKRLQRSTILSIVANNLLLQEDNPSKGEPLRNAAIRFSRPDSISFYGMIWQSLFSGIKGNIGMTPERQLRLQQLLESFKNEAGDQNKIERKHQRTERRRRRQSRE
jgi:hypothetical protein